MRAWKVGILEAMVLIGCGGGGDSKTPDAALPPDVSEIDAATIKEVHGVAVVQHVTDTGVVDQPRDLSGAMFASYSPTATGYNRQTGVGTADGKFVVPVDLGATEWLLSSQIGTAAPQFLVGSSTTPDLGFPTLGRADVAPATLATPVTFNVTGADAWQDLDSLQLLSSNAGLVVYDMQFQFADPPVVGSTTITGQLDWKASGGTLIDAAKGDQVKLYQLATKTSGAETYNALAKIGTPVGFSQTDGQPATMNVALAAVLQDKTFSIHFLRSQFEALRADIGPGATTAFQLFAIDALPGAATRGFYASSPDLVMSIPATATTDLDQTFTYGNPFATAGTPWDEFVIVQVAFRVPVLAPGATMPRNVSAFSYMYRPISAIAGGNIAPLVTPVRNVTAGGMDLSTPRTGVGLTPTITWEAPTTGAVTYYTATFSRVAALNGATTVTSVGTFHTKSRSLQLPSGILQTGGSYVLRIEARVAPGYDATVAPFKGGLDFATATKITAQFQP